MIPTRATRSRSAALADPLTGLALEHNGPDSAQNQTIDASFIALQDYLSVTDPAGELPAVRERDLGDLRDRDQRSVDPHTGESFMWSQRADQAYKRLARTIDLTAVTAADGPTLSFWTSYNLELDFDYMIIEAHPVGTDDWTTLPDPERAHVH